MKSLIHKAAGEIGVAINTSYGIATDFENLAERLGDVQLNKQVKTLLSELRIANEWTHAIIKDTGNGNR